MKDAYHKIKIEDNTAVLLIGDRNSLTTVKAYRENGEKPHELEEYGYYIPLGSAPEAYLVEEFRFSWLSVDSYGKPSYRTSKTLAGIRAAVDHQLGPVCRDGGYVTTDGIAKLESFQAKASGGGKWRNLPLGLAIPTKADLEARWALVNSERATLREKLEILDDEAKSLVERLDAMHRAATSA